MVNLAGSRCFAKFRKNILTLTKARTSAQSVVKGVVIPNMQSVTIVKHCYLDWNALAAPGTTVDGCTLVGPQSTTGLGATDMKQIDDATPTKTHNRQRLMKGAPIIVLLTALSQMKFVVILHWTLPYMPELFVSAWANIAAFTIFSIYVITCILTQSEAFFILTALYKWSFIGPFKAGVASRVCSPLSSTSGLG